MVHYLSCSGPTAIGFARQQLGKTLLPPSDAMNRNFRTFKWSLIIPCRISWHQFELIDYPPVWVYCAQFALLHLEVIKESQHSQFIDTFIQWMFWVALGRSNGRNKSHAIGLLLSCLIWTEPGTICLSGWMSKFMLYAQCEIDAVDRICEFS